VRGARARGTQTGTHNHIVSRTIELLAAARTGQGRKAMQLILSGVSMVPKMVTYTRRGVYAATGTFDSENVLPEKPGLRRFQPPTGDDISLFFVARGTRGR
jgi:hypothetical protein